MGDDIENTEDVNMVGYPFDEHGYTCKSLQSMYNDLFLHYKIERGVYRGFESDTLFSLNSISSTVVGLGECEVEVEEAKLQYLQEDLINLRPNLQPDIDDLVPSEAPPREHAGDALKRCLLPQSLAPAPR